MEKTVMEETVMEEIATDTSESTPPASSDQLTTEEEVSWHPLKKILFRFAFIYFFWYILSFFKFYINDYGEPEDLISRIWDQFLIWIASSVLQLEGELRVGTNGSGDTTADYLHILAMLIGSAAGCLIWTVLDRNRPHYRWLAGLLLVGCRYYLAAVLLGYGFAKVFTGQFSFPRISRLLQPFGEASPMGLIWTFMGYSKAYTVFAGLGEVVGGLLLFFRRTTTLGALVCIGVMSNVVMLNYAYDVPVKLFSSHLLIMSFVLLGLDARRMANVLVFNRPTMAMVFSPYFPGRRAQIATVVVKVIVVGALLISNVSDGWENEQKYGPNAPKPPLYGLYDVESFILDGEERPPLLTDTERWQNMIVEFPGMAAMRGMDGKSQYYVFEVDEDAETIAFATPQNRDTKHTWTFERPTPDSMVLEGELEGKNYLVRMKQRDLNEFLLVNRGFNWINEFPYNR